MSDHDTDWLDRISAPLYFATILLVALPALDLVANIWPLRFGDVGWRYGAAGLMSGYLLTPLLGLLLAWVVASLGRHRRAMLITSVFAVFGALVLVVIVLGFALDALQVRSGISPENMSHFEIGALKALLKYVVVILALLWPGIVGWRIWRAERRGRGHRRGEKTPLVRPKGAKGA